MQTVYIRVQAPGALPFERGGEARQKFWVKPLKETNLGMGPPFFLPLKETILLQCSLGIDII